jgi:hypothetical protein
MPRSKAHHAAASALKKVALLIALCVAACGITPSQIDIFNIDAQNTGTAGTQAEECTEFRRLALRSPASVADATSSRART